jgi:hypothetical protein
MAREIQAKPNVSPNNDASYRTNVLRVGDLNVRVKNRFYPDKSLYDILFSIVNLRLKEKSA